MFLQVRIPEKDRGAFRFLWWADGNLGVHPAEYQMSAHPFGAKSSPFCTNFALRQTADDYGHLFDDMTKRTVKDNFYVDDCLMSLRDVEVAKRFVTQVCGLLQKGGFRLRKWVSNSREAVDTIPLSERADPLREIRTEPLPFGLTLVKRLLQALCQEGLGWDEPVSAVNQRKWEDWYSGLRNLSDLRVPRRIRPDKTVDPESVELHVFYDASEVGYGAVVYVCFCTVNGERCPSLLFAKSRVALLKAISIPRLELVAAVLAVRVYELLTTNLKSMFTRVYVRDGLALSPNHILLLRDNQGICPDQTTLQLFKHRWK
ncbi:uncharacterized protein DEA37_0010982 [Paragonimus westermani]|uniref:Reverse transcriptase domain-containing protein n=1 Tax=Paragonimus westermani TaxID=34504 RepID=A0A5J4NRB3_9TREM|nr:uncharacterized protein DEA37_0010982 [Paragonimus westermani]